MAITLSSIIYYPIKSCRGTEVAGAWMERAGLARDRRMMVVTLEGNFLSQRQHSRLAWVVPTLVDDRLKLSARDFDSIEVAVQTTGPTVPVHIRKDIGIPAVDLGDEAARWMSDWLGQEVRVVHIAEGLQRRVNPEYAVSEYDHTGFSDGYPILLISEESLTDLNSRLDAPLPMNRFRPNLVVRGCTPFEEDSWRRIRINGAELAVVKPCPRCEVTTIDKETLERRKEPLKTLATFRKRPGGVMFGQNVIPVSEGVLEVGMEIEVVA